MSLTYIKLKLIEIITIPVTTLGFGLVGIKFICDLQPKLRIYIDSEKGITVDNCVNVSYLDSAILDIEDPISMAYSLEVSSPGLNRPLFTTTLYRQFIGKTSV